MDNEEEAIDVMARTFYEHFRASNGTLPIGTWPTWDRLHHDMKHMFLVAAAKAHEAYHDRYEYLANQGR